MQVIYGDLLRNIVGGYQNDCFWRCVAYLDGNSGFNNPISESLAEYYAVDFNPEAGYYSSGDSGVTDDIMQWFYNENKYDLTGTILKIDPDKVNAITGSGYHAVVVTQKLPNGSYRVYDPQHSLYYDVPSNAVEIGRAHV